MFIILIALIAQELPAKITTDYVNFRFNTYREIMKEGADSFDDGLTLSHNPYTNKWYDRQFYLAWQYGYKTALRYEEGYFKHRNKDYDYKNGYRFGKNYQQIEEGQSWDFIDGFLQGRKDCINSQIN